MAARFQYNRLELAGSLGDLGTLLPIGIAMILVNGMDPVGLFITVGLFYIFSGLYFGVTVPVQPMKVIGGYAIATAMTAPQILSSSLLMGIFLLVIGTTGIIDTIKKLTPVAVVRGVQLATGLMLIISGIRFIIGQSKFQIIQKVAEPYLNVQSLGPIPIGLVIGIIGALVVLALLESKKYPAGLVVVLAGCVVGVILGARPELSWRSIGFSLPTVMGIPFPTKADFTFALFALVLPQLPMTLGNAVLAYTDLSKNYFGEQSKKVTNRAACISMACANFVSFLLGGMPLCHGAGGLAAHYRFGARTAGSNLMIGLIFLVLALFLGSQIVEIFYLLPMAILGVLLIFGGAQLSLTIMDLDTRKDFFIALLIPAITLATNLAAGFLVGVAVAQLLKWKRFSI